MSRLYLFNPCALFPFLHTVLRAQSAPGFPCALSSREGQRVCKTQAKSRRENESACFEESVRGCDEESRRVAPLLR
jgi:hypothetical protein